MLKFLGKLPKGPVYVALSGGVDSVSIAHFLSQTRETICLHFNHGTPMSSVFEDFCVNFCKEHGLPLNIGRLANSKPANLSPEEHWRNERYSFLDQFQSSVVTGHNLNDQVETWIWSALHGTPKLIPYRRNNVVRPFILSTKEELTQYAKAKSLNWVEDPSNQDPAYTRNFIRHTLLPNALQVNPGLFKVIKKKCIEQFSNEG